MRGKTLSEDKSTISGSAQITEIVMTNYLGEEKEIRNIVSSIRITESLYSPVLILKMSIRDEMAFFELFKISGNEKISITFRQRYGNNDYTTTKEFFVTEYPEYRRGFDNQLQVYTLTAFSLHGYLSPLKNISRSIGKKSPLDTIRDIMINDLQVPEEKFKVYGDCLSDYKGIITWTTPLRAALDLTKTLYDTNGSSYFLYENFWHGVTLVPMSMLRNQETNPVIKELYDKTYREALDQTSPVAHQESDSIIREIKSQFDLSRLDQANRGAFASRLHRFDISNKSFVKEPAFDILEASVRRPESFPQNNVYQEYRVNVGRKTEEFKSFNQIDSANLMFSVNQSKSRDGLINRSTSLEDNISIQMSQMAQFNICSHDIEINGDLILNSGTAVNITFAKSTDPAIYKEYSGDPDASMVDAKLSGRYIVVGAEHQFINGSYLSKVTVNKDSL